MKKEYLQPQLTKRESVFKHNLLVSTPTMPVNDKEGEENEVNEFDDLLVKPNYSLWDD